MTFEIYSWVFKTLLHSYTPVGKSINKQKKKQNKNKIKNNKIAIEIKRIDKLNKIIHLRAHK